MRTWWKVARTAGVCIQDGRCSVKNDPLDLFMNISRDGAKHFRQWGLTPQPLPANTGLNENFVNTKKK